MKLMYLTYLMQTLPPSIKLMKFNLHKQLLNGAKTCVSWFYKNNTIFKVISVVEMECGTKKGIH